VVTAVTLPNIGEVDLSHAPLAGDPFGDPFVDSDDDGSDQVLTSSQVDDTFKRMLGSRGGQSGFEESCHIAMSASVEFKPTFADTVLRRSLETQPEEQDQVAPKDGTEMSMVISRVRQKLREIVAVGAPLLNETFGSKASAEDSDDTFGELQ